MHLQRGRLEILPLGGILNPQRGLDAYCTQDIDGVHYPPNVPD